MPSSASSRTSLCILATAATSLSRGCRTASTCCARCPMLILWGMKDFVFDHHFLDEWVSYFPDAEVHRFPEAGHYLFEDEADAIERLSCRPFSRLTRLSRSTSVESNLRPC